MSGSVDSEAFETRTREREAQTFAMWIFLVSETLIFGAFILVYLIMRHRFSEGFDHAAAETSIRLGTANTVVLLTSSLTMALADIRAEEGRPTARAWLVLTALLGTLFLGIKIYEWHDHVRHGLAPFLGWEFAYDGPEPHAAALFFRLYFALTGLHALHLAIGIALVAGTAVLWRRIAAEKRAQRAAVFALYWHLIDVVWLFLFAFFYLAGRGP
ncbi:MAG TPA: cytochrome c oxidase subunit 3 [Paracoccaceae bacterium]|nr:cytochrome c oxidase subunit 3 [Paracoccaceae bacterium]